MTASGPGVPATTVNFSFTGSFRYSGGDLTGGTVTGMQMTFGASEVFYVSNFSMDVVTLVNYPDFLDAYAAILSGNDSVLGGAWDDYLEGYTGADTINGGAGNDTIDDPSGVGYLRGDEGNDIIRGGSSFDDINGNMGNDTASGGLGGDWVVGGRDNDRLFGDAGGDIVYGNMGDDTCDGGADSDIVRGGQDNDVLFGQGGDDWLSGDRGSDTVTGGAGADIFHTFGEAGLDRVTDFIRAEGDRVMLDPGTTYAVAQVGADTVITMGGGGQMVLAGVQMSSLTDGWIFGA
jgi:Ca2+-binding RTX toxin-like protein